MKYLVLFFIIAIPTALLIRDIDNPMYSFIGDEYQFYVDAKKVAHDVTIANIFSLSGVYGYHPVADTFLQAGVMKIIGTNLVGWKFSNILVMTVSTIFIYLIAQTLWQTSTTSIVASVFFAFSHYLFAFAHIGYNNLHALVPALAGYYFYCLFLTKKQTFFLIATGLCAGFCFYTFYSARIITGLLLLFAMSHGRKFFGFLIGMFLPLLPLLAINKNKLFLDMFDPTITKIQTPVVFMQNYIQFLRGLIDKTVVPTHHFVVGPLVSPILLLLFFLAVVITLRKKSLVSHAHTLFILWFFTTSTIIVWSFFQSSIPITRLHIIVVPMALLGAYALTKITRSYIIICLVSALYAISELYIFYAIMPTRYPLTPSTLVLQIAKEHPTELVCIGPNQYKDLWFLFEANQVSTIRPWPIGDLSSPPCDIVIAPIWDTDQALFTQQFSTSYEGKSQFTFFDAAKRTHITYYR